MWRAIAIFLIGGILGTAFGVATGFFVYPYVFPPPEAMETLSDQDRLGLTARGRFIHANPADPIHYGNGKLTQSNSAPTTPTINVVRGFNGLVDSAPMRAVS